MNKLTGYKSVYAVSKLTGYNTNYNSVYPVNKLTGYNNVSTQ